MPRIVELTVSPQATEALLAEIGALPNVLGVQVQRSASVQPPGDVITVHLPTEAMHALLRLLDARGVGRVQGSAIATSEPVSLVSPSGAEALVRERSEASWEEMEALLGKESNMSASALLLMALSGLLATVGIASDALHLVVAAMLVAPGFEPLARVSLGMTARTAAWRRGLADTAKGYAVLIASALLAALVLRLAGLLPTYDNPGPLEPGDLVSYWTSLTLPSLIASMAAATTGGLLIATNRTVLTSGTMVALALVPSAALIGMGLATGRGELAVEAAARWALDAALVLLLCWAVFVWKGKRVHRRRSMSA